jgi:hypothetical protein
MKFRKMHTKIKVIAQQFKNFNCLHFSLRGALNFLKREKLNSNRQKPFNLFIFCKALLDPLSFNQF